MCLLRRLILTVLVVMPTAAEAETGRNHHGHSKYHHAYKGLMRPDAPTSSCCNENDCRPTAAKFNAITGNWEAIKDGRWVTIPKNKIVDGDVPAELASEAHLCAPPPTWPGYGKDDVFCLYSPQWGLLIKQ